MQIKLATLYRLIVSDRNTRNLFFFLLLNLFFAFVELTYGLWTNSLGLISDSFHMFFDCSALLLGLAASLITKWRPSDKFTYGFGRAEILAGLANGLFLLFIALFIMKEAIERTFEPPEVHHERLFVISVLGFLVNLVGIFVFQHGGQCSHSHSHSSHGHNHSHSHDHHHHHHHHNHDHDNHEHQYNHFSSPTIYQQANIKQQKFIGCGGGGPTVVTLDMNNYSAPTNTSNGLVGGYPPNHINNNNNSIHNHEHSNHHHNHQDLQENHQHHHNHSSDREPFIEAASNRPKSSGRGQIMQSVFLHIVADTLGSVGVMISALLMNQFGWMIADPLCSLFIAILISISVYPLLRDSFYVLMQRVPVELEDKLPNCFQRIQSLSGVLSVHETHFWTLNSDTYIGCLKLEVAQNADHKHIMTNAKIILNQIGVDRVHIQIDQV